LYKNRKETAEKEKEYTEQYKTTKTIQKHRIHKIGKNTKQKT
jgi:hypothetical protein